MNQLQKLTTSEKRKSLLLEMGISSLQDVVMHLPYKYDVIEESLQDDHFIAEGQIIESPKIFFKGRFSRLTVKMLIKNEEYTITIFNRHFLRQHLTLGKIVTVIGKREGYRITASQILLKTLKQQQGMHPVYSLKEGLTDKMYSGYVKKALSLLDHQLSDFIPLDYKNKYQFQDKKEALKHVHFPASKEDILKGMKQLKYEEFLQFQLTMQYMKLQREQEVGIAKVFSHKSMNAFIKTLPFKLTPDQQKACLEIFADIEKPTMMYRFLQGDVGSGKTVVSSLALYANYLAHYQGALMAPTEVLATQHYETLKGFFKNTDVSLGLLVGSLSLKEKEELYLQLEEGKIDILIGTHALFQEKVNYKNLGLVITDEQHRFGVKQRQALKNKGQNVDFLLMSATPIPRTLALAIFGDMDVSEIHSMPKGRRPIITKYFEGNSMKPFLPHLLSYLQEKGQVYVITSMIEDNEDYPLKSATQVYQAMSRYFKGRYQVGLLHGNMKEEEKNKVMNDFHDQKIQILVSTTVVEVGIDVKNANMIILYDAERFGLSSIHQLRGRVGRGGQQGYCYLLSNAKNEEAIERLHFMENHTDGYEISQYDLQIRGPGEVLGKRQSGVNQFVFGDAIKDFDLLRLARNDAIQMIESYYKYNEYEEYLSIIKQNIKSGNEYID